jgi:hypothetical protein
MITAPSAHPPVRRRRIIPAATGLRKPRARVRVDFNRFQSIGENFNPIASF